MSRRKHDHPPIRLPADGNQVVSQLANGTGWSRNETFAFLVRAGWNALNSGADKIPAMRQVMTAAVAHQETETAMRKRLAVTAKKLRVARNALDGKTGAAP